MSGPGSRTKTWRWRFQFSLGTLFIFITLLGVGLGIQASPANRQRRAIEAVTRAGGLYRYDDQPPDTDEYGRTLAVVWPSDWILLRRILGDDYFSTVVSVDFATDRHYNRSYRRSRRLEVLEIDDELLRCIEDLPDVKVLELGSNKAITDEGLVHLRNCRKLRALYLYNTGVTGTGLRHLAGMPALTTLSLRFSPVTDDGLVHVGRLPSLAELTLRGTTITDAGTCHLASLKELRHLDLRATAITDAGVKHLERLSLLEELHLPDTISDEAVARLRRELPSCRIAREQRIPPGI